MNRSRYCACSGRLGRRGGWVRGRGCGARKAHLYRLFSFIAFAILVIERGIWISLGGTAGGQRRLAGLGLTARSKGVTWAFRDVVETLAACWRVHRGTTGKARPSVRPDNSQKRWTGAGRPRLSMVAGQLAAVREKPAGVGRASRLGVVLMPLA